MEKYLMSSPTQLSHLFLASDTLPRHHMDDEHYLAAHDRSPNSASTPIQNLAQIPSGSHAYEELDFAADLPDFSYDHAHLDFEDQSARFGPGPANGPFVKGHSKHFSVDGYLLAPFSLGNQHLGPPGNQNGANPMNAMNPGAGPRYNFHHLRNVSLDDSAYRMGHRHTHLLTSNPPEPPSGSFLHLVSTSTFELVELVPQLSLLVSNKLLLDLPYLSLGAAATTPGRRKMSTSVSSGNLYTTPLRGSVGHLPSLKVAKLQILHRRNRLRASVDPGLALLLASIANMKSSTGLHGLGVYNPQTQHQNQHQNQNQHQHQHQNHQNQNQNQNQNLLAFYHTSSVPYSMQATPTTGPNPFDHTLISPGGNSTLGIDDYEATPLATPAHGAGSPPYFTPIGHNHTFGGSLEDHGPRPPAAVPANSSLSSITGMSGYAGYDMSVQNGQGQNDQIGQIGQNLLAPLNLEIVQNAPRPPQHSPYNARPPAVTRNASLGPGQLEDQDDDACAQFRRTQSFVGSAETRPEPRTEPRSMLSRSASMRNLATGQHAVAPGPGAGSESGNYSHVHAHAQSPMAGPFQNSVSVDLLSPKLAEGRNPSSLRSYPASIDLAAITKLEVPLPNPLHQNQIQNQGQGLSPPLPHVRSASSVPALGRFHESLLFGNLAQKSPGVSSSTNVNLSTTLGAGPSPGAATAATAAKYPNLTQIKKSSTSTEIAQFAESILNSEMKRPIVIHEEPEEEQDPKKKHKCPLCFARFQRPEHVKRHMKSHSSEKPFQCDRPECGRRFNRKDNLKAHLKKIHHQTTFP